MLQTPRCRVVLGCLAVVGCCLRCWAALVADVVSWVVGPAAIFSFRLWREAKKGRLARAPVKKLWRPGVDDQQQTHSADATVLLPTTLTKTATSLLQIITERQLLVEEHLSLISKTAISIHLRH